MAASSPSTHLLHLLRSHPCTSSSSSSSSSSFVSLLKPLLIAQTPSAIPKRLSQIQIPPLRKTLLPISNPLLRRHSFASPAAISVPQRHFSALVDADAAEKSEDDEGIEQQLDDEEIRVESDGEGADSGSGVSPLERNREERLKLPSLTVKERKELSSYANSLGKKLKSQLVGKSGVTSNVASAFIENLESNELLKIKIHRTCPGELEDVVKQLEEATGSVTVGQIGRTVIIYRPSLTKLKAEEKKKQARKVFLRKQLKPRLGQGKEESKFSRRRSALKQ